MRGLYVALPALLMCGCGSDAPEEQFGPPMSTWVTESQYEFGGAPEAGVIFQLPSVYADPGRDRILVLDTQSSQVSAWALDGSMSFAVGRRGEGPGEFNYPQELFVETDGSFSVLAGNGSRFTTFSSEGELVEAVQGPPSSISYQGFRVAVAWPRNNVYLGVPLVAPSIEKGTAASAPVVGPMTQQPLLRVRRSLDGQWHDPASLLSLDYRSRINATQIRDGSWAYGAEPFADADQIRFDPGRAVVLRQNRSPGGVELTEVNGQGDTIWHRPLQFEPKLLTPEMIDEKLDVIADALAPGYSPEVSRRELRQRYAESLYKPQYLPTVERFFLTASGEVWIRTHEVSDTLRAGAVS